MFRVLLIVVLSSLCQITAHPAWAADPHVTEGRVSAVTVYQGQALVTREVEVAEAQGLLEVVVTNLPQYVLPGSLFAEPVGDLQIRSVRYRVRPIEEDVRQEVRELDEQIQDVDDKLAAVAQERALLHQRNGYLVQLGQFTAITAQQELKSGVLNAETLKDLTLFQFSEREQISQRELELAREERSLNKSKDLLVRKRDTISAGSSRTVREAVVFVNVPQRGPADIRLSYLVSNASWSPSYNLRATNARDQVTVEYNASIQQMSGEDWNDVDMNLSTATPSLVAKAPELEPLAIKLGSPAPAQQVPMSAAANYKQTQEQLERLGRTRGAAAINAPGLAQSEESGAYAGAARAQAAGRFGGAGGLGSWGFEEASREADKGLNRAARQLQLMDLNNSLSELKGTATTVAKPEEGVSVSYQLENRTSLPSRSDRQLIQIASIPLQGEFYRLATPVLTSFAYEEVRLTNTSNRVLLAGPAATFLGGQFVGRGEVPTVSIGESFSAGLGIDSSLRTHRELVDKKERIQGGNRVVDFTYELTIENFGNDPVSVRLLDRLPTVGEDDIKVTLVESDEALSDDETYLMADRKDGILRWDLEVPAQAVGPQQKVLRYTMQIEYDKQLAIIGMPTQE